MPEKGRKNKAFAYRIYRHFTQQCMLKKKYFPLDSKKIILLEILQWAIRTLCKHRELGRETICCSFITADKRMLTLKGFSA